MGARAEIESRIKSEWVDPKVAAWVISKFPLLEKGFACQPCPVYDLSLSNGLSLINNPGCPWLDFLTSEKIVMSGGFEGTEGHLRVVEEMYETRSLTAKSSSPVALMLEPDSYIRKQKGREPLVYLDQRVKLWSTSGLVDVIITLPDKPEGVSAQDFYDHKIHDLISPATWCVNVENSHFFEIMNRGQKTQAYDLVRLFVHHIEVHTSFLNSTRGQNPDEVKERLHTYLSDLVASNRYTTSPGEEVEIFMERISQGL